MLFEIAICFNCMMHPRKVIWICPKIGKSFKSMIEKESAVIREVERKDLN